MKQPLSFRLAALGPLLAAALAFAADELPRLTWPQLFSKVSATGAEFSETARSLEGKRVLLRGHAVARGASAAHLYLASSPAAPLHPDDYDTLPWDAAGVVWRKGLALPQIPPRPTIEGTLRLGSRKLGEETVVLVLEDAVPFVPKAAAARR